jgi:hypothetical protein
MYRSAWHILEDYSPYVQAVVDNVVVCREGTRTRRGGCSAGKPHPAHISKPMVRVSYAWYTRYCHRKRNFRSARILMAVLSPERRLWIVNANLKVTSGMRNRKLNAIVSVQSG